MPQSDCDESKNEEELEEEGGDGARAKGMNPGTVTMKKLRRLPLHDSL
jgi:hypothetical protein